MPKSALPESDSAKLTSLTVTYTQNVDGWVTAQLVEYPSAISQGATRQEAWVNVMDAFHDLTHEPTLTERIAFSVEAGITELRDLLSELGGAGGKLVDAATEHARAAADRGRTGVH